VHTSFLTLILCAVAGLVVGSIIVFVAPRLVAYRLDEPTDYPPAQILVPIAGAYLTGLRLLHSLLTELVTAAVFVGLGIEYGWGPKLLLSAFYSALLIAIAYIDLDHRLVLNRLSYPGVFLALLGSFLWPGLGIMNALAGALIALVVFLILQLISRGALGTGDTKLAVLIGAMRGIPTVFNALLLGVFLGAFAALVLLIVLRRGMKATFAYAPYLAGGAVLSFFIAGQ
jgi:leader peptidase (prepilin peptidase)/N-methyltransferase